MKKQVVGGLVGALLAGVAIGTEVEAPKMPVPQQEHDWLMQFVGDWDAEVEMFMEPGKPPVKSVGTESVKSVGGFWIQGENKGSMMDKPFVGIMTLGYDMEKKCYVGSWVDSMSSFQWQYKGSLDSARKVLTLEAEGPCPGTPGKMIKVKELVELKNKDHRTFTSFMQGEDGKWVQTMLINYHRKK